MPNYIVLLVRLAELALQNMFGFTKKWYIYKIKIKNLVYLVLLPSMVRRKMASPPLIKSLLLALRWVRYAAVP